jgi:hypothetical protein
MGPIAFGGGEMIPSKSSAATAIIEWVNVFFIQMVPVFMILINQLLVRNKTIVYYESEIYIERL